MCSIHSTPPHCAFGLAQQKQSLVGCSERLVVACSRRQCLRQSGMHGSAKNQLVRKHSAYVPGPVLETFWDLRTSSSQPNFQLRFLSHGCASTNDVCKQPIHVFKTTNGQKQNHESIRPNYERCLTAAGATFQKIRISRLRTEIFSEYDWRSSTWNFQTTNPATKPKFARVGKKQPRNYEGRGRTVRCVFRDKTLGCGAAC